MTRTSPGSPNRMPARTKARKRALDILFECEVRGLPLGATLDERVLAGDPPVRPLTAELVRGVVARQAEIEELIVSSLVAGWTMDRMPRVDRCLARMAVWELLDGATSAEVALQQAVQLAQELSTDGSAAFLNGLLARVRERLDGQR